MKTRVPAAGGMITGRLLQLRKTGLAFQLVFSEHVPPLRMPDIVYVTAQGELAAMVNERNGINRNPSVSAGPNRTLEYQNMDFLGGDRPCFTIVAIGSDPDLHRLSYEWRNSSGAVVEQAAAYQFCAVPGVYAFTVSVADGRGGAAHASVW